MDDTIQLNSGEHTRRDTYDDQLALDPELVAAISNCDFIDINAEDAEYQRQLALTLKSTFIASVLDVPCSTPLAASDGPSTSASCANSNIAPRTPEPVRNEHHFPARDVRSQEESYTADREFDFDDLITSSAYEHSDIGKHEQSMPPPSLPSRNRFDPPVNIKAEASQCAQSPSPASAYLESPTEPHNELFRSISKRGRQDTSNTLSGLTKKPSVKRHKQQKGGFPCKCTQCPERFDRACDEKKHYQRTHAPKDSHPHSCSLCQEHGKIKRFLYPKDLRRHFKQVHSIITTELSPSTRSPSNISPGSETSPKNVGLWAIIKTVVSFKKLRISVTSSSSSPQHKVIMVSQDQRSFMDVDVTGLLTPEALMQRIRGTLGHAETLPPHSMQAQTYRRQYGRVQLGEKLDAKGIFAVVSKNADSEGSLRLLVSTGDA